MPLTLGSSNWRKKSAGIFPSAESTIYFSAFLNKIPEEVGGKKYQAK